MTPPTNTYTVTFSDAHSHTVQLIGVPGNGGNTMAGKADALRNALQSAADNAATLLATFTTPDDTMTVTVTQP